jgi:hypothetical protein
MSDRSGVKTSRWAVLPLLALAASLLGRGELSAAASEPAPGSTYITSTARVEVSLPTRTLLRAVFPRSQASPCYLAGYSNLLRS